MTNQQILEKAIQKAIDGGFNEKPLDPTDLGATGLIFNHDFAKALWGNPEKNKYGQKVYELGDSFRETVYMWQYHLQQMVIAEDPIKYLGDNL